MKQDFAKKIVIVVNKELAQWQVLNTIAHTSAYLGHKLGVEFGTGESFITADQVNHPRNSQYPIIILKAKPLQLPKLMSKVRASGLLYHGFIREMIETTDDQQIEKILYAKQDTDIEYLGIAIYGPIEEIDKLTKSYQLWH
jgi:hypothetical protein